MKKSAIFFMLIFGTLCAWAADFSVTDDNGNTVYYDKAADNCATLVAPAGGVLTK